MTKNERVVKTIFSAVDEINLLLPKSRRLDRSIDTVLVGESGALDSLGFITFIVATEQKIEEEFGVAIILSGERAASDENNPFQSIGTLADHVSVLLGKKLNEKAEI